MPKDIGGLRDALMDLTGVLNHPGPDQMLLAAAGLPLDRALFPLLSRLARFGGMGVGELADLAGKDYTTVSRQLASLEKLGLIARQPDAGDKRVRRAELTVDGKSAVQRIDRARERLVRTLLAEWSDEDFESLVTLLRRLAGYAMRQLNHLTERHP